MCIYIYVYTPTLKGEGVWTHIYICIYIYKYIYECMYLLVYLFNQVYVYMSVCVVGMMGGWVDG